MIHDNSTAYWSPPDKSKSSVPASSSSSESFHYLVFFIFFFNGNFAIIEDDSSSVASEFLYNSFVIHLYVHIINIQIVLLTVFCFSYSYSLHVNDHVNTSDILLFYVLSTAYLSTNYKIKISTPPYVASGSGTIVGSEGILCPFP